MIYSYGRRVCETHCPQLQLSWLYLSNMHIKNAH